MPDSFTTTVTLLTAGAPHGPAPAWAAFVEHHRPLVVDGCQAVGLAPADADRLATAILNRLARDLPTFTYDPATGFRGWLREVVRDVLHERLTAGDCAETASLLADESSRDSVVRDLDDTLTRELRQAEAASQQVRARVGEPAWRAFWLTTCDGLTGGEAAARLGMPVAAVYVARGQVARLLREAREHALAGPAPGPAP